MTIVLVDDLTGDPVVGCEEWLANTGTWEPAPGDELTGLWKRSDGTPFMYWRVVGVDRAIDRCVVTVEAVA